MSVGAVDVADRRPIRLPVRAVDASRSRSNFLFHIGVFWDLGPAFGCDLKISHFTPPFWMRLQKQFEGRKALGDSFRVVQAINPNDQRSAVEAPDNPLDHRQLNRTLSELSESRSFDPDREYADLYCPIGEHEIEVAAVKTAFSR